MERIFVVFGATRPGKVSPRAKGLGGRTPKSSAMTQTKFTIAVLVLGFTIAALIVFSAVSMGAVAGS